MADVLYEIVRIKDLAGQTGTTSATWYLPMDSADFNTDPDTPPRRVDKAWLTEELELEARDVRNTVKGGVGVEARAGYESFIVYDDPYDAGDIIIVQVWATNADGYKFTPTVSAESETGFCVVCDMAATYNWIATKVGHEGS